MLADDPLTDKSVGGTVYQASQSCGLYNCQNLCLRWYLLYSDPRIVFKEGRDDPVTAIINAQPYLSEVATRALIFIEADNPYIGLMCFMGIGMVEVSTCDIKVYEGQRVKKGQETVTFHFGASAHCLIFNLVWNLILIFMVIHQALLQQIYQLM